MTRGTVGGGTAPKGSETKKPGMAGWGARRPRSQKALPVRQSLAWVREVVKDSFGLWRRKARLNTNWRIQGFQGAAVAHPGPPGRWVQGEQEPTPLAGWAANPGCEQCLGLGRGLFVLPDSPDCPSGNWPPRPPQPALRIPGTSQRLAASPPGRPRPPLGRAGHFPPKRAHFFALLTATCKCPPGAPGPEHNSIQKAESGG